MFGRSRISCSSVSVLCAIPERNQPVLVGPQSVRSIGPAGYPCLLRKRERKPWVFQAPVEM